MYVGCVDIVFSREEVSRLDREIEVLSTRRTNQIYYAITCFLCRS